MVNQSNSPTPATANGVANGKPSANNSSQSSPAPTVSNAGGNAKAKPSRRVDVEPLMKELHRRLGPNWDRYRDAVTDFVIGQLNRAEFDDELDGIVVGGTIKLHNQFMLSVLTNALRDPPPNTTLEWSRKRKDPTKAATRGDPRIKTLKAEVMAIPAKERRRIKGSAKEAAKRHTVVHPSCMLESRVAKLPRIPIVKDKVTNYAQTILQGYHAPLATSTHSLPEDDALQDRMLGIAIQNGIVNGIAPGVRPLLLLGLETHLKTVLEELLPKARVVHGQQEKASLDHERESMGTWDFSTALYISPHVLVEGSVALMRLWDSLLHSAQDRDEAQSATAMAPPPQRAARGAKEQEASHGDRVELAEILDSILAS